MHASATSLAASLVDGLGVSLGERLLAADAHNPAGYFEDLDFGELQSRMMLAATPADDGGHPDWGWTEHSWIDPRALEPLRQSARSLIATRAADGRPWGWKNPRTAVSLDFWDSLLNEARYLFIYRYPWEVADSLQRLAAEVFLRNPRYAYSIWEFYNRRILEFLSRAHDRCLLVSANALLSDPERLDGLLRDRLGLAAPSGYVRSRIRPDLFRSEGWRRDPLVTLLEAVRPECIELLRELDRQADLSSAGLWGALPRVSWSGGQGARPRVSVLVPCYNHGEFLLEAVASAERACQEEPLELVIIDDGSDEAWTLAVLKILRHLGYQILRQENRGLAAARNAGTAIASGDFLLPLDADDRLRPEFPSAARRVLEAEPDVGVVYCDYWEFGLRSGCVCTPDFDLPRLLRGNYVAACACLRRRVWEECGGWDEALSAWEDWDLWIGAAGRGWRFHRFPGIGFDYRRRPDSMVTASAREEVGKPLQEHIVRKHRAVYLSHLPELLIEIQNSVRETEAARQEQGEALHRLEKAEGTRDRLADRAAALEAEIGQSAVRQAQLEGERDRLAKRAAALEAEIGRAAARQAELEGKRDRLYQELAAWRGRVAFMEGTAAWRMRLRFLDLRRAGSRLLGAVPSNRRRKGG
ncbi:MAG TPA: glycosyltransferase [Thermoanaerobaculia bacterium]|nr:glycosyltransferase [Thermoanaerobaculia bacterium]